MGDLLRQASQWLERQRRAHGSSPVTYRRGAQGQELIATFGRMQYEVQDESGLLVAAHGTDFLVAAADFAPAFGEPQPGDRIIADGETYEVMSLAGQGHWRWSDPYRQTMRIHTRQVGTP